ncbi:MAG: radical SAM protein [Deltaproteobacteria bacterium]|jgi:anaerobic ribonucleoside-triphosphate reductase activating protein|nr:radical SAM protein [Deltaproteobacteria bacterium]
MPVYHSADRSKPADRNRLGYLYVGFLHAPLTVLGPGTRVGLWLAGCGKNCTGCLSPELAEPRPEQKYPLDLLLAQILDLAKKNKAAGLTVSGGEPFDQGPELLFMAKILKTHGLRDILVYSGEKKDTLLKKYPDLTDFISALVDGPYEQDRPSKEIFRGSAGQTLHVFDEGLKEMYQAWSARTQRQVQILVSQNRIRLLGIPGQGGFDRLKDLF